MPYHRVAIEQVTMTISGSTSSTSTAHEQDDLDEFEYFKATLDVNAAYPIDLSRHSTSCCTCHTRK